MGSSSEGQEKYCQPKTVEGMKMIIHKEEKLLATLGGPVEPKHLAVLVVDVRVKSHQERRGRSY